MKRAFWPALCLLLLVAGCGKGGFSQRGKESRSNVFTYALVTSPTTLDPHKVEDGDTIDLLQQVFQCLVAWGEDSKVKPMLAESWKIEDGGRTYVFSIKKDVQFHNGQEVTAEDAKWSIERATTPGLKSTVAGSYLTDIVGVKEKLDGKAADVAGVQVRDPYTLVIKIDKPRPYFLGKLTYLVSAVLPKDSVPLDQEITKPEQMIGTGPFVMKSYVQDQQAVLEAFPNYHEGAPQIERIERPVIKDAATRLIKYKAGELDLVQLQRQDVATLQKDPQLSQELKFFDRPAIYYVGMSPKAYAPFADRRVRQAIAMAIDKETIVQELLGGVNTIANGILPPGVVGHRTNARVWPYDPKRAAALLAEAGYPGGKGLPPLELNFRDSQPDLKIVSEAVAQQLERNLGIKPNLRSMEWTAYLEKRNKGELQLFHMRWMADYLDPENFLSLMLSTTGNENKLGYSNPEFDALCSKADTMPNGDERLAVYAKAEDLVLEDAPWVPIYFQRDAELISGRVKGLRESLFGHLPHWTVRLDPRR